MSRVCIVVLEEVEDDEPSPLHSSKIAPDHVPQNSAPETQEPQEEKPSLLKAIFNVDPDEVRSLIFKKEDVNVQDNEKRTPLHAAAYLGDAEIIELLILSGARVNAKDNKWLTPLHRAVASCSEDAVQALLKHSADVNARDKNWQTPLHVAAANKAVRCAEALVPQLSNVNVSDRAGRTALHHAAFSGHLEMVKLLLSRGANINAFDKKDRRAIHWAAYMGKNGCASLLRLCLFSVMPAHRRLTCRSGAVPADRGASVSQKERSGFCWAGAVCVRLWLFSLRERGLLCSPAFVSFGRFTTHALSSGSLCLEYLLRNDANPGIRDKQGYNAVHYASAYGHRLCLELITSETPLDVLMETSGTDILNDTDGQTPISPLHLAAYHGHHPALEVLVQSLLDLDVRTVQGHTPLDLAAFKGHVECVDVLITQGASILLKDYSQKRTPIHAAAMNGHLECLRLLIGNADPHAAVDVQDGSGQTPLMLAVLNGHTDCVYFLLSKGASVEAKDKWGRTALHRGAVTGHEACVEALLQHSASLPVRDSRGRTAMHLAAACGHIGVLGALLQAAQSLNTVPVIMDNCGYTPLHWACYNGHDTCVEALLEQEVFHKMEGNSFSPLHCAVTPLHAAAYTDHVECLQLLLGHNAQVNAIDALGKTPLMMAAENGQTNAVEVLVSRAKADLTLQDANKNSALHLACSKGHETSALLILEKVSDRNLINATNAALQTPLHVAARNGLTVVVQELLGKGASVLAVDENGYTPALACAPNKDVADCLALILATMMPVSPGSAGALPGLTFSAINHYCSPSKAVTFDPLPALRSEHGSYCSFNNLGREDGLIVPDDELNDSDSETY
uniref:Ankyrin repeat domain 28 n=1 Tax=Astyanax mexicanus TaxID=7994 RepID=A0A8B9KPF9_ASTMX